MGFSRFDRVALTMTAELCDCFATKRQGVRAVIGAVSMALPESPLSVWGLDGRLHPLLEIQHQPRLAAAANWLALATVAARMTGEASGLPG